MLDFFKFLNEFTYVMVGSFANDVAPLLVGSVNVCDNQHQNISKSLGFEVLIQCYCKKIKNASLI
jgi:hypothetical protein